MSCQNPICNVPVPLPYEIVIKILNTLSFREKMVARRVCNYWRSILDSFGNYKFHFFINNNALTDYLLNSFPDLEILQLNSVTKPMSSTSTYSRNKYPRIRKAYLGNQNCGPVVLSFLKYGMEFTELFQIREYAFINVHPSQMASLLGEVEWKYLHRLVLTVIIVDDKMKLSRKQVITASCFLEFARIPHLKEFNLYLNHNVNLDDDGSLIKKFCSNIYGFISRHSETLKSLSWTLLAKMPDGLPILLISNDIMETIRSNLKLKTFKVLTPPDHHSILALALPSVCGSDSLSSFSVCMQSDHRLELPPLSPELSHDIDQILQRSRMTLTDVELSFPVVDMNWLRNCHKLESLSIEVGNMRHGLINQSSDAINFPGLKSFSFLGYAVYFPETFEFSSWIVERMTMLEKIKFITYVPYLSIPLFLNIVNGLNRLKKITVELDDKLYTHFMQYGLNTFCDDTKGLTFKYFNSRRSSDSHRWLSYDIEIDR